MSGSEIDDDAASIEPSVVPKPVACDVTKLALSRVEAFVLSQIDGRSSVDDLASLVGLSIEEACAAVATLLRLGAIRLPDPPPGGKADAPSEARRGRPPSHRELPRLVSPDCVPRIRATNQRTLDLAMSDGFVLAQVDGRTSVAELAAIAGVELDALAVMLRRLEAAGALELPTRDPAARPATTGRTALSVEVFSSHRTSQKPAHKPGPSARAAPGPTRRQTPPPRRQTPPPRRQTPPPRRRPTPPPAPAAVSNRAQPSPEAASNRARPSVRPRPSRPAMARAKPADDGPCELETSLQDRIRALHALPATASHYELLDVARDADRKVIKKAYFGFVARLHPDRHFRKKLGSLRQPLQDVFVRVTAAYDALDNEATRARYDESLARAGAARGQRPKAPDAASLTPPQPSLAPDPPPAITGPPAPTSDATGRPRARIRIASGRFGRLSMPVSVPADGPAITVPPSRTSSTPAGGASASVPPGSAPASAPGAPSSGDAGHALRRFSAEKIDADNREHARVFIEAAERELSSGNVVAAAAQFQLALKCAESPEIRAAFEAVEVMAQARRFEISRGQAEAAERDARWSDAVAAYTRAHAASPEGRVGERLANAIRLASGDLRLAAKLAEDAVQQEPMNAAYHATLGEVYLDAGLDLRALSEVKRALELAPADARAQALAAKLAKLPRSR